MNDNPTQPNNDDYHASFIVQDFGWDYGSVGKAGEMGRCPIVIELRWEVYQDAGGDWHGRVYALGHRILDLMSCDENTIRLAVNHFVIDKARGVQP